MRSRAQIESLIIGARVFQEIATKEEWDKAEEFIQRMTTILDTMPIEKRPRKGLLTMVLTLLSLN